MWRWNDWERRFRTPGAFFLSLLLHTFVLTIPIQADVALTEGSAGAVALPARPLAVSIIPAPGNVSISSMGASRDDAYGIASDPAPATVAPLPIALPFRHHYIPADQLQQKPVVVEEVYPGFFLDTLDPAERKIVLRLRINELGSVDEVIVDSTELSPEATERISLKYSLLRFRPGMVLTFPVKSELVIEVVVEGYRPSPLLAPEN